MIGYLALGVALGGCGGGGGGGGGPSTGVGFTTQASAGSEGAAVIAVVELSTSKASLGQDLQVTLAGTGTSSAADHDFVDRVLTFPAGSVDGDTLPVTVNLVDDGLVEGGDETLILALSAPTQGGLGGGFGARTHAITLQETDFAQLAFTAATSATAAEADVLAVDVELSLDPGDALGIDVDVTLRDSGAGSATSGLDFQAVATQVLRFPVGSTDGTRLGVSVVSLDDVDPEGDETVELRLQGPTGGAQLTAAAHTLTITDDDLAGTAFLVASGSVSGGSTTAYSSGVSLDLGTEPVGSGPNGALSLTLQNAGGQSIQLDPLALAGDTRDFSIALDPGTYSMPAAPSPPAAGEFPFRVVQEDARHGACLAFDAERCDALDGADAAVLTDVPLPGGGELVLELERVALPFAPGAVVRVGDRAFQAETFAAGLSVWRGRALGYPGSEVLLTFSSEAPGGWVRLGDGRTLHLAVEPPPAGGGRPVVRWMWESQLAAAWPGVSPATCEGERTTPGAVLAPRSSAPSTGAMPVGLTIPVCTLAIETDYQLYQKFGSTSGVTQYVTGLIAAVSDVYERDAQTRLEIAYLGVHDDPDDGWTAQDAPGATATDVLNEFQAAWAGSIPAGANLAHFMSGASLGGGVAYLGVLCNPFYGFGVSGSMNGNINWGSFSGAPSNATWDFVVVAHELGHNFGASHTHEYCPPLDMCYANCNGGSNCPQGTLMSYCHVCGGMNQIDLEFHPFIAQELRDGVAGSCLASSFLAPGESTSLTISFQPTSGTGGKAAQLDLPHTAPNEPDPFRFNLSGTATN